MIIILMIASGSPSNALYKDKVCTMRISKEEPPETELAKTVFNKHFLFSLEHT